MWMIQSVLVGQQGVEGGADLDQPATVLVFTGQAIDLEAEDQADVAQGDLREQPGEIVAAGGGGAGAALIAIEDADALGGQPQARARSWSWAWTWADSRWRWTCWGCD